jgi:DNA polymerase III delta subunit
MITLIIGGAYPDQMQAAEVIKKEYPNAVSRVLDEQVVPEDVCGAFQEVSLFEERRIIVWHTTSQVLEELLDEIVTSLSPEVTGIIIVDTLLKSTEALVKKYQIPLRILKKATVKNFFDTRLADACMKRDKKKAWLLVQEARRVGEVPEAILGRIVWKYKDRAVKQAYTKENNPDYFADYEQYVHIYHDSHRGGGNALDLIERFILSWNT